MHRRNGRRPAALVFFGIDVVAGFPFNSVSPSMDIGMIVCSLILGYISWATLRQQK